MNIYRYNLVANIVAASLYGGSALATGDEFKHQVEALACVRVHEIRFLLFFI